MTLKIALNHQLKYSYDRPIILGPHKLGLKPSPHSKSDIFNYSLNIAPKYHNIYWYQDIYGNFIGKLNMFEKTDYLSLEINFLAEIKSINPFNFLVDSHIEKYPFYYTKQEKKELSSFLEIDESSNLLINWVNKNVYNNIYITDFLVSLNQQLASEIKYITRLEEGIQTCEETLRTKKGSCRDTTVLLIQILRHYGLAARFVSGYLIQFKTDDQSDDNSSIIKEDNAELHAWCEVYLPGAGWIGLDPTSGFLVAEDHIPLISNPNAMEANPVRGTKEFCKSKLDFSINISRL